MMLREQLGILHRRLLAIVRDDEVCRRLMTVPGVGPVVALTYRATVDVPARFRNSKAVGAVFGLTPSKYQSGESNRTGAISRPPEVKDKLFSPFFTTKPAGEGTGLGLSISHDIIVKQHGGSIEVDTQPGEFTEFRITLPRAAVFLAKSGGRG